MKLPFGLIFFVTTHLFVASATLDARSAPFEAVLGLTTLSQDRSRKESVQRPDKYFHEAAFDGHYDGRFAEKGLPLSARTYHLRLLLKSYMETMDRIGIKTWMMHGCLLGWFWNGRIMPWDNDVDFMVEENGMRELGEWWNMTVHRFSGKELGLLADPGEEEEEDSTSRMTREQLLAVEVAKMNNNVLKDTVMKQGKKYLLEVNPHYTNTTTRDRYNVIDARWIDTSTGLYIDITAVHTALPTSPISSTDDDDNEADEEEDEADWNPLYTKDQHAYLHSQLFPLRATTFERVAVKVPYDYSALLAEEYGDQALTHTWYRPYETATGYGFDEERGEWVVVVEGEEEEEEEEGEEKEEDGEGDVEEGKEREKGGKGDGSRRESGRKGWMGRGRRGGSAKGRGKGRGSGWRRRERTADDILEGREGAWEWAGEDEDGDGEGGGLFEQFGGVF